MTRHVAARATAATKMASSVKPLSFQSWNSAALFSTERRAAMSSFILQRNQMYQRAGKQFTRINPLHPAAPAATMSATQNPASLFTIPRRYVDNSVFMKAKTPGHSKLHEKYMSMCDSGEIKHDDNQEIVIKWLEEYCNTKLYANQN